MVGLSFDNVLTNAQQLQRDLFGKRNVNVNTADTYISVSVFTEDAKDVSVFTFYNDWQDDYDRKAQWQRLEDWIKETA